MQEAVTKQLAYIELDKTREAKRVLTVEKQVASGVASAQKKNKKAAAAASARSPSVYEDDESTGNSGNLPFPQFSKDPQPRKQKNSSPSRVREMTSSNDLEDRGQGLFSTREQFIRHKPAVDVNFFYLKYLFVN